MLVPALVLAGLFFFIGVVVAAKVSGTKTFFLWVFALVIGAPGLIFAAYYLKIFNEPIWLYRWRSVPFSELSASGIGFLMGYLQQKFAGKLKLSRVGKKILFPVLLLMVVAGPYLKPIFRPIKNSQYHEKWSEGVCLQSTDSTCGPASAVTLLRARGQNVTEKELAMDAFTSISGTENWYLNRALKKRGLTIEYKKTSVQPSELYFPAMAGVRLAAPNGSGHFIAILDRQGENYIVGDPLIGRLTLTLEQLKSDYYFTGFFMLVK